MLRPGDIDVIAAMGDSLTAGFGILSSDILSVITEYRGMTFTGGGQQNWREYLTLPNILKVFNPKLFGYAVNTSLTIEAGSEFNIAEAIARSKDMPQMAMKLVNMLKNDKRVNMEEDWKMINLFIGSNDLCHMCYEKSYEVFLERHREDMVGCLRILRDNIPRCIVNYIALPSK